MQAPRPNPQEPLDDDFEIVQFASEEEFRAWSRENVADWEEFVKGSMDSIAQLNAWQDAGNTGFPPGWISRREYERQRGLRSDL
jgi:hypothetical protein